GRRSACPDPCQSCQIPSYPCLPDSSRVSSRSRRLFVARESTCFVLHHGRPLLASLLPCQGISLSRGHFLLLTRVNRRLLHHRLLCDGCLHDDKLCIAF